GRRERSAARRQRHARFAVSGTRSAARAATGAAGAAAFRTAASSGCKPLLTEGYWKKSGRKGDNRQRLSPFPVANMIPAKIRPAAWTVVILAGILFRAHMIHQLPREVELCASD